ncbi:MAG: hypothetical protein COA32_13520 [Fluviicola sp.]|nr:MAG: hypothetical protein COA32_13520 [Fluviicola sp.]
MAFDSRNKVKVEGGMASMTDLVFLLLVFFIIMSTMAEKNTPVELPQPSETLDSSMENTTTTVVITEEDMYQIMLSESSKSNNPFGVKTEGAAYEQMREFLIAEVERTPEKKVKIAGARKASYEAVFQVLALSKARGWKPVLAYD